MILRCTNKLLGLLGKRTVAASVRKHDLQPLGPFVVGLIEAALRQEHLPADVLGPLVPDSVHLARTASRSVLGFMNDMVLHCRRQMEASCGLDFTDVEALNERLRRTLHDHDGYCESLSRNDSTPASHRASPPRPTGPFWIFGTAACGAVTQSLNDPRMSGHARADGGGARVQLVSRTGTLDCLDR